MHPMLLGWQIADPVDIEDARPRGRIAVNISVDGVSVLGQEASNRNLHSFGW